MTDRDIAGLVERLNGCAAQPLEMKEAGFFSASSVMEPMGLVPVSWLRQAAAALTERDAENMRQSVRLANQTVAITELQSRLTALEAERDGMRAKTIEECAKVADAAQEESMRPHTRIYPWVIASRIRFLTKDGT